MVFQNSFPTGTELFFAQPLNEAAYHAIKRDIIRCQLAPGSLTTEVVLAERYGVGRAAVRTALNRLYQERLVQPLPRQGYLIAPITRATVDELFDVRLIVEPAAARLTAERASAAELDDLRELAKHTHYPAGAAERADEFLHHNKEFHVGVARASGNERLAEIVGGLLDGMERFFHFGLMIHDRRQKAYHEHHDLVEALAAGDGERAASVLAEQIVAARTGLLDAFVDPSRDTAEYPPARP